MFVGNVLEMWGSFWEFFLSNTLYFFLLCACVFSTGTGYTRARCDHRIVGGNGGERGRRVKGRVGWQERRSIGTFDGFFN